MHHPLAPLPINAKEPARGCNEHCQSFQVPGLHPAKDTC